MSPHFQLLESHPSFACTLQLSRRAKQPKTLKTTLARELILYVLDHQTDSRYIPCHFVSVFLFLCFDSLMMMSWITKLAKDKLSVISFHFLFVYFDSHDGDVLDHQTDSKEENIECHFVSVFHLFSCSSRERLFLIRATCATFDYLPLMEVAGYNLRSIAH